MGGDAAHATSPAIGMGMNTALADAAALDELMDQHKDQLTAVLPAFSRERVKEGNALTYLALHAYSMSMSQGLEMQIRGVVRKFFHGCFPRWVMEEPLATVAKGGKLSEAYDALVQLAFSWQSPLGLSSRTLGGRRVKGSERTIGDAETMSLRRLPPPDCLRNVGKHIFSSRYNFRITPSRCCLCEVRANPRLDGGVCFFLPSGKVPPERFCCVAVLGVSVPLLSAQ